MDLDRISILVEKFTPLMVALGTAVWVVYQYNKSTSAQNIVTLEISRNQLERAKVEQITLEQQAELGSLEVAKKGTFQVDISSRLSAETLNASGAQREYLVHWEVRAINQGGRTIAVDQHSVEVFLGRDVTPTASGTLPTAVEFNHPTTSAAPSPRNAPVEWKPGPSRSFKSSDLYNVPIGEMSPGDNRYAEFPVLVRAEPGTWIYVRSTVALVDDTRAPPERDRHSHWEYFRLPTNGTRVSGSAGPDLRQGE